MVRIICLSIWFVFSTTVEEADDVTVGTSETSVHGLVSYHCHYLRHVVSLRPHRENSRRNWNWWVYFLDFNFVLPNFRSIWFRVWHCITACTTYIVVYRYSTYRMPLTSIMGKISKMSLLLIHHPDDTCPRIFFVLWSPNWRVSFGCNLSFLKYPNIESSCCLGDLQWPFWTKLIVVGIGFIGGLVFMYIQCKVRAEPNLWSNHSWNTTSIFFLCFLSILKFCPNHLFRFMCNFGENYEHSTVSYISRAIQLWHHALQLLVSICNFRFMEARSTSTPRKFPGVQHGIFAWIIRWLWT